MIISKYDGVNDDFKIWWYEWFQNMMILMMISKYDDINDDFKIWYKWWLLANADSYDDFKAWWYKWWFQRMMI